MRRFGWIPWLIAAVFLFGLYFGISFLLGKIIWNTWDLWEASFTALFAMAFTYWVMANARPKVGGVLRIDTTRDHKDIWRFEIENFKKFDNDEYVLIEIKRRHVPDSADEYVEKVEGDIVRKE